MPTLDWTPPERIPAESMTEAERLQHFKDRVRRELMPEDSDEDPVEWFVAAFQRDVEAVGAVVSALPIVLGNAISDAFRQIDEHMTRVSP